MGALLGDGERRAGRQLCPTDAAVGYGRCASPRRCLMLLGVFSVACGYGAQSPRRGAGPVGGRQREQDGHGNFALQLRRGAGRGGERRAAGGEAGSSAIATGLPGIRPSLGRASCSTRAAAPISSRSRRAADISAGRSASPDCACRQRALPVVRELLPHAAGQHGLAENTVRRLRGPNLRP